MEELPVEPKPSKKSMTVVVSAVVLIIAGLSYVILRNFNKNDSLIGDITVPVFDTTKQTIVDVTVPDTTITKTLVYKNGVYSVVGDYISPGGAEQIGVEITLKDDVIVDAKVESKAFRPNSVKFQGQFRSGFSQLVIGKNIDEVYLDKVSGSSLTPKGFNDALEKIKTEAKV